MLEAKYIWCEKCQCNHILRFGGENDKTLLVYYCKGKVIPVPNNKYLIMESHP